MSVMPARDDRYNPAINNERADTVKVEFLATMNPNEFLGKNMMSTVAIMRLASEHWWFLSCQMCHRKSFQAGSAFVCSNKKCGCTSATPRYKVRLIGADESGETEFVFFASVAEQAIGKRLEVIMCGALDRPFAIPAEISALISKKFTLHFTVNEKGLHYGQLSFQVNSITQVHTNTNVFEFNKLSVGSSSTSTETSMESSKVSTTSNDKEPEDKEKDNTNESDKNGSQISPTADSVEQIAPSTAKEQETPSSEIATASISDSPSTSKKTSKRTGTEANKSTFAKKKMHLS